MDVFISYSRRDIAHARTLDAWLTGQGVSTFFDQTDLGAGQPWAADLERAIAHDTGAVAVLLGPSGLGNTQFYEYQFALSRQRDDRSFPVIPIILPGTKAHDIPRSFLDLLTWVDFRATTDPRQDPAGLQRLLAAIRREPVTADVLRGMVCPYKGLAFFEESDSALFFGRDTESEALLDKITRHNVAAVIGRSGSGKSSLVRAGLLPRLRRTGTGSLGAWDSVVIRPGQAPLFSLAQAFSPLVAGEDPMDRTRRLEAQEVALRTDRPDFLATHIRTRADSARLRIGRTLVVVDQAEELFAVPPHITDRDAIARFHADRDQFIRLLLATTRHDLASLVLTIRSDHFDDLMHSEFEKHLTEAQLLLHRIADLKPCIERPAEMVGLRLAQGLADQIVDDVGNEEANLPLMQYALERTWEKRSGSDLTHEAYVAVGGVKRAINDVARECYCCLAGDARRDAARRLFLRLVRPGTGDAHIRIRAVVPTNPDELRVMEIFADPERRLLVVGEQGGVREVEIAHEALVRGWDELRGWVDAARDKLRVRDAVRDWMATAEAGELLPFRTALFQGARELLADQGDVRLEPQIESYIQRSVDAFVVSERDEAQRRTDVLYNRTLLCLMFFGAFCIAVWGFFVADQYKQDAVKQSAHAIQQSINAESAATIMIGIIDKVLLDPKVLSNTRMSVVMDAVMGAIEQVARFQPHNPAVLRVKAIAPAAIDHVSIIADDDGRRLAMASQFVNFSQKLADTASDKNAAQSDLAVAYTKVGDVQVSQGNLTGALTSYGTALTFFEHLADLDDKDPDRQRPVAVLYIKIGDIQVMQGVMPAALGSYRMSLTICNCPGTPLACPGRHCE